MKKLICILSCVGMALSLVGCSDTDLSCDDKTYITTCYDTTMMTVCTNGEEARVKCPTGFSCRESSDGADCEKE